jgi:alpha-mannosidase
VQPLISAVGHTHLDVGWLWRVMHTRDKTGRSFATVLNLMTEYPDFVFMYNQSVLFNFLKTDYPEIWERLKKRGQVRPVRDRRRHVGGARRQHRFGRVAGAADPARPAVPYRRVRGDAQMRLAARYLRLFGQPAAGDGPLRPRVLHHLQALWNDTDRHPWDTFFWKGIDGTVTKAQLITAQAFDSERIFTTYNSDLSVSESDGRLEALRAQGGQ